VAAEVVSIDRLFLRKLILGHKFTIRVHLKHLGHPVAGDPQYGRRGSAERHYLHAWKLAFKHPATGKRVHFTANLSPDFPDWALEAARGREGDRMEKFA
jgi:23S rRNA pseudouridine1911/1915/1917 synthase